MYHRTKNANVHPSMIMKQKTPPSIRISQYRPSFAIQLLLRLTQTPHLVFNSSSFCTEGDGPLPTLMDVKNKVSVGVNHDKNEDDEHLFLNGILSYLLRRTNHSTYSNNNKQNSNDQGEKDDIIPLTPEQKAQRQAILCQHHNLDIISKCLRYDHEPTWDAIYKPQCINAHLFPNGDTKESMIIGGGHSAKYQEHNPSRRNQWNFITWFQIWAERIIAKKEIESDSIGKLILSNVGMTKAHGAGGSKQVNLKKAIRMANDIFSSLDYKLGLSSHGTLLDSQELSIVDVILFDHLCNALCDIHLVATLIEYKHLIAFFERTYESYFGKEYQLNYAATMKDSSSSSMWIQWNDRVNALNQFNRIPMNDVEARIRETLDSGSSGGYQDAIKMMQAVALHCHDLREILADVAILRKKEEEMYGVDTVPKSSVGQWMHKLRMGGELSKEGKRNTDSNQDDDNITKKNELHMKKMLREAKQNDELWISTTIVATMLGLFASVMSSS